MNKELLTTLHEHEEEHVKHYRIYFRKLCDIAVPDAFHSLEEKYNLKLSHKLSNDELIFYSEIIGSAYHWASTRKNKTPYVITLFKMIFDLLICYEFFNSPDIFLDYCYDQIEEYKNDGLKLTFLDSKRETFPF